MPKKGDRVRFPSGRYAGVALLVDHVAENGLVWCVYPGGDVMPFIGRFLSDNSLNTEAEIVE